MNNGKKIEKLVRLIQESLKDFSNTKIYSNYRIENTSGRKREIDVLIKTEINRYELIIAIECKDYKSAIPVEKIEAFNSKCARIKGISKKIFVATNGYQADSYEAAKDFDIELYNLDEIDSNRIIQWFPIKELKARYLLKPPHEIAFQGDETAISKLEDNQELIVHFYDNSPSKPLNALLWDSAVYENQRKLKTQMLFDFMKYESNLNFQTIFPYELNCKGIYVENCDNEKINIARIKSSIVGWLEEAPAKILEARTYNKIDSETIASVVTIDAEKNETADIVYTENNEVKVFRTNPEGQVFELKTLFEYDPRTDKIIDNQNNNEG